MIIARVTWLLALGDAVKERQEPVHVPVYLGDALQWNLSETVDLREVMLPVPAEAPLYIPAGFAEDQAKFDPGLRELTEGLDNDASAENVERALRRIDGIEPQDARAMAETFARIKGLKRDGRNGIWPFILRNLIRPVWLSRADQRADAVIGNPPWVAYRHLSPDMKTRLRDACQRMNLWVGGVLATQQDLSALFWARCAERYLRPSGTIAFVLPYAALNRPAFAGLRAGDFQTASVRIVAAWSLELVRPLLPTSACVLIGRRELPAALPSHVARFAGTLPRRDAIETEADRALTREVAGWPPITTLEGRRRIAQDLTTGQHYIHAAFSSSNASVPADWAPVPGRHGCAGAKARSTRGRGYRFLRLPGRSRSSFCAHCFSARVLRPSGCSSQRWLWSP